jgi:hypothetical protein
VWRSEREIEIESKEIPGQGKVTDTALENILTKKKRMRLLQRDGPHWSRSH